MAEGRGPALVYVLITVFGAAAFALSLAGELHPNTGGVYTDFSNDTYCVYQSGAAFGYAVAACLLLLFAQVVLMVVTGCMCCGSRLARGGSRACAIVFLVLSWISFVLAETNLVVAANDNSYRAGHGFEKGISCSLFRKALFLDGAIFAVATTIFNIFYYMCFTHAARKRVQLAHCPANPAIGMNPTG